MKKLKLTEDWTATIIGGFVILLGIILYASLGYTVSWPTFKWSTGNELLSNVLTIKNFINIFIVFIVSYDLLLIADVLQGKPMSSAKGFPLLFDLTIIAMIIGGNSIMNYWGLETFILFVYRIGHK